MTRQICHSQRLKPKGVRAFWLARETLERVFFLFPRISHSAAEQTKLDQVMASFRLWSQLKLRFLTGSRWHAFKTTCCFTAALEREIQFFLVTQRGFTWVAWIMKIFIRAFLWFGHYSSVILSISNRKKMLWTKTLCNNKNRNPDLKMDDKSSFRATHKKILKGLRD